MNKTYALFFALMVMTVSLAGCIGQDDENSNSETPTETLEDWQVHFASSAADLPVCESAALGHLYYVEDDVEFQVCTTSGWEVIEISGLDGAQGEQGVPGEDGISMLISLVESTSCESGGHTFDIGTDLDADGLLDISEVSTTVEVCNGSQGIPGQNGADGETGLSALIASTTEESGVNCGNGGTRIDVGVDDNADGLLDAAEVDQTQYVCNGGSSNTTTLTLVTLPPTNMGCDAGGHVVSHGLDNGDGGGMYANGILEPGEIDVSTTLCSRTSISILKDIHQGSNSGLFSAVLSHHELTLVGSTLYFPASDGFHGIELWKSDGTSTGTMMVKDINPGGTPGVFSELTAMGNMVYFRASDGTNGQELWKSDGTNQGTVMVKDIYTGDDDDWGYPVDITAIGNTLYFSADDGVVGQELWKSDGTTSGTVLIKDIDTSWDSNPYGFTSGPTGIYFSADDGTHGKELWVTDGTASGTTMIKDIDPSPFDGSDPSELTRMGNTVYFRADDGTNGHELWQTDGTASGTTMVKDIFSGSSDGLPYGLTVMGAMLYFSADDGTHGLELWQSDGTTTGTTMVKDIYSGAGNSGIASLTAIGNMYLLFGADDGANGSEVWISDGTATGTVLFLDVNPGPGSSNPASFIRLDGLLYFVASGSSGYELYYNGEILNEVSYS